MKSSTHWFILFCLLVFGVSKASAASSMAQADSLVEVAMMLEKKQQKAQLLVEACQLYSTKHLGKAVHYGKLGLAVALELEDIEEMIKAYLTLGKAYQKHFDYENSLHHYLQAIELAERTGDVASQAEGFLEIARASKDQGRYSKALDNCFKSLRLYEFLKDNKGVADATNVIGIIQKNQGRYKEAMGTFEHVLKLRKELADVKGMAGVSNNIGLVRQHMGESQEALDFYFQAIALNKSIGNKRWVSYNYNNIGNSYMSLNDLDKSLEYYQKSLEIKEEIKDERGICSSYLNIGQVYFLQGKNEVAIPFLREGLRMAVEQKNFHFITTGHDYLQRVYETLGDYKTAFTSLAALHRIEDSLHLAEEDLRLTEMESIYNQDKREQEIQLLKKDRQVQEAEIRQKDYLNFFLMISLGLILLTTAIYYNNNRLKTIANNRLAEQNDAIRAQQEKIQAQQDDILSKNEMLHQKNAALEEANKEAERASKAKAAFLSTMSHEIRTPLNAIIGMTHMLMDGQTPKDQLEQLRITNFSAKTLLSLVNDILDFSKIDAGKIIFESISFHLRNLLLEINESLKINADGKRLPLVLEIEKEVPDFVLGDPVRLTQILTNLIGNAIKFTETGEVRLVVAVVNKGGQDMELSFTVKDTGIGIPKEKHETIFKRFQQADSGTTRNYGGTGLGLAITKQLVELQQGRIEVESAVGKGSKFTVFLGFGRSQDTEPDKEQQLKNQSKLQGYKVLLVEDNLINQKVACNFLRKWEMYYEVANNGQEALKLVSDNEYDLILMDIQMPIMDGFEATRRIRKMTDARKRAIPIVALTASAPLEVREKIFAAGVSEYVIKPFNPSELFGKLEKCILGAEDTVLSRPIS